MDGKKISLLGYGAIRLPTADGGHANNWVKEGYTTSAIDQALLNRRVKSPPTRRDCRRCVSSATTSHG